MFDSSSSEELQREDDGPPWRLIIAGLLAVAVIVFLAQNRDSQDIEFLWIGVRLPLWLLIVISVAIGMAIDRLVIWRGRRRDRD